jgi:hypothetical protein
VPNLSVGRIELDVDNLQADINLAANIAGLVSINAGVSLSIQKINLTIVGNYLTNMTYTGESKALQNGLVQKTYSYSPLSALVNIIFNAAGQIVQATVAK